MPGDRVAHCVSLARAGVVLCACLLLPVMSVVLDVCEHFDASKCPMYVRRNITYGDRKVEACMEEWDQCHIPFAFLSPEDKDFARRVNALSSFLSRSCKKPRPELTENC